MKWDLTKGWRDKVRKWHLALYSFRCLYVDLYGVYGHVFSCMVKYMVMHSHVLSCMVMCGYELACMYIMYDHMVSLRQEQNPIMKFAVPFLKMFTLCMLWRARFLSDFYSVFCIHQILSSAPLLAKIQEQKVSQKVRIFFLLLAIIQDEKTLTF